MTLICNKRNKLITFVSTFINMYILDVIFPRNEHYVNMLQTELMFYNLLRQIFRRVELE